jgi:type II secretory pathway component PulJ
MKRAIVAIALFSLVAGIGVASLPSDVSAQTATCRSKCNDEEQACLKRTGNKSQCGNTANQCMAKCK